MSDDKNPVAEALRQVASAIGTLAFVLFIHGCQTVIASRGLRVELRGK